MFVTIKTNGATHIAIHVPHLGADKTLPALAAMLEQNATFINSGYGDATIVKPTMGITLGDKFVHEHNSETDIAVAASGAVIGEDFVTASPEVFVSNAKGMKRAKDENDRLSTENRYLKSEVERLKASVTALEEQRDTLAA